MQMSDDGLAWLTALEGVRRVVYRDSAGLLTIGVGHLITDEEQQTGVIVVGDQHLDWRAALTDAAVRRLLTQDVQQAEAAVTDLVRVALTPGQYEALVSFVYNVGRGAFAHSTLLRTLNAGNYEGAHNEFRRWIHAGGHVVDGLRRRRDAEAARFAGTGG